MHVFYNQGKKENEVKTIRLHECLRCNVCHKKKEVIFDIRIVSSGPDYGKWMYICEDCLQDFNLNYWISSRLVKRSKANIPEPEIKETVTVPVTLQSVVEIECPYCSSPKRVEPDANYDVMCGSCGHEYHVESGIL